MGPVTVLDPGLFQVDDGRRVTSLLPDQPLFWARGPLVVVHAAAAVAVYANISLDLVIWDEQRARPFIQSAPRELQRLTPQIQRSLRQRRGKTWDQDQYEVVAKVEGPAQAIVQVRGAYVVPTVAAILAREEIPFAFISLVDKDAIVGSFTIARDDRDRVLQLLDALVAAEVLHVAI